MPRDRKTSLRLNDAEYHYISQYSARADKSLPDYIRTIIHNHILSSEGPQAAVHILHGDPPGRSQPP